MVSKVQRFKVCFAGLFGYRVMVQAVDVKSAEEHARRAAKHTGRDVKKRAAFVYVQD